MDYSEVIGRRVFYYDYLGLQQKGYIVYVEPTQDPSTPYLYIASMDSNENIHQLNFANGSIINYVELRLSSDVILFENGDIEDFDDDII